MISFRFIVIFCFVLLLGLKVCFRRKSLSNFFFITSYLDVAIFFWIVLLLFFFDALVSKKYMVPGDILYNFYPWKALSQGRLPHNPLLSDITGCVYPWMVSIKKSMLQFTAPLWNQYSYSGCPLAANQVSAAFHPFNLFFYFMSVPDAATLFPFLRLFIAAMGGFALLRSWKLSIGSAILGSTMFCFCGVHISWLSNYPEVSVTMLIPWIFLSIDQIAVFGSIRWLVVFILLSVLQFLGGHCETSFHLYAWAIPFFFFRLGREKFLNRINSKVLLSRMGMIIFAGILSLGLSGFQLLPFLEYLPLSTRMHAIASRNANLFIGLNFFKVFTTISATLISPDFFGNPVSGNYWGAFNYIEQNSYITVTGLFLALMAFGRNKKIDDDTEFIKYFFILGGLFAYLIAVRTPGLFDFIVSLPLFKQNSNHRLIIIFSFAFSILAAFGVNDIQAFGIPDKKKLVLIAAGFLLAAFLLFRSDAASLTLSELKYRWIYIRRFLVFLFIIFLLLYLAADYSGARRYIPALATCLILIEVFSWGWNFNTFVKRKDIFPSTPLIHFIQSRQGTFRVSAPPGTLPVGTEQVFEFDSITGLDPMKSCSYERIFSMITGKYDSIYSWNPKSFNSPWINFLNVRYIAAPPGTTKEKLDNENLVKVYSARDGVIFKNPKAFARIFRVNKVLTATNSVEVLELVKKYENMLAHIAIIEDKNKFTEDSSNGCKILCGASHPEVLREKSNYIRIHFKGSPGGMYVMSEQYYPGWHLKIDGKPAKVFRTDYAFMGFWVPDNTSIVELYYDPMSFRIGCWISLIFGFGLVCFVLFNKGNIFARK